MPVSLWHWLVHQAGIDQGAPYGRWVPLNFWSGIAGSFLVNLVTFFALWYVHHTCHDSWRCLRWGKFPAAGGVFRTCWRHHPDSDGARRPSRDVIRRLHRDHQGTGDR